MSTKVFEVSLTFQRNRYCCEVVSGLPEGATAFNVPNKDRDEAKRGIVAVLVHQGYRGIVRFVK